LAGFEGKKKKKKKTFRKNRGELTGPSYSGKRKTENRSNKEEEVSRMTFLSLSLS
jgi:hypothetical protein